MGLRLYQPPVESDLQSKPAADRSSRSRSTIRRVLDHNDERLRERRRRVLAAAGAYNEPSRRALLVTDRAVRRDANRPPLDDRAVTMFGERWAHLHAESNPNLLRDDDNEPPSLQRMAVEPDFLARRSQPRPEPTYALSNMRSTQAPGHPSRTAARPQSSVWSRIERRQRSPLRAESGPSAGDSTDVLGARLVSSSALPWSPDGVRRHLLTSMSIPWATEAADLDGLGDRNRSLSPEGDNVWDTLLTTLTPDPQPPSVGSSFASASASAAATQSTAAASSSRTSFTTPDNATEESAFEPPCESGCDNSDTEGEEEDEMEQMQLPYFPRLGSNSSRSYADRARGGGGGEDPLELLGGIGGMQRIVRNLARREDIPDEWWAEAGLSRTLSREAGN